MSTPLAIIVSDPLVSVDLSGRLLGPKLGALGSHDPPAMLRAATQIAGLTVIVSGVCLLS